MEPAVIRRVVERAARAPSGGNLQPWHIDVIAGEKIEQLRAIMARRIFEAPKGEPTEYDIYPKELHETYAGRRFQVGEDLYRALGIPRENKAARMQWFARNFAFFGAPVALFMSVAKTMGPPQWSDMGMYLQSVMMLLREEGLDSCPQECWAIYPDTIRAFLNIPQERMLFTGMAIGYKDPEDPANRMEARRAPVDEFATFYGL